MLGGEVVADDENVGNQAIGNFRVVDLLRSRTFGNCVAHIGIPCHGSINFFLGKKSRWFNSILGMDGLAENLVALLCAESGGFKSVPQQKMRRSVRSKSHFL